MKSENLVRAMEYTQRLTKVWKHIALVLPLQMPSFC